MMLATAHLTVVGLGLMGGSLAKALRGSVAHLAGFDSDLATRRAALREEVVQSAPATLAAAVAQADALILATPVRGILAVLADLPRLRPDGCLVMDLGSTKADIGDAMERLPDTFQAIGGHPMCGKEVGGLPAASADLYRGHTFILSRNRRTSAAIESFALSLLHQIGARPLFLPAAVHDEAVAAVSHLPYLAAISLINAVAPQEGGDGLLWQVSASGFRDTARLAGSDPVMLLDVLLTNREAVLSQLERFGASLAAVTAALRAGDERALRLWLAGSQEEYWRYRRAVAGEDGSVV